MPGATAVLAFEGLLSTRIQEIREDVLGMVRAGKSSSQVRVSDIFQEIDNQLPRPIQIKSVTITVHESEFVWPKTLNNADLSELSHNKKIVANWIEVSIAYEGARCLWQLRADGAPRASFGIVIGQDCVWIRFLIGDVNDSTEVARRWKAIEACIEENIALHVEQLGAARIRIQDAVLEILEARRERQEKLQNIADEIEISLAQRDPVPVLIPVSRRPLLVESSVNSHSKGLGLNASPKLFRLSEHGFFEILEILDRSAETLERYPSSFGSVDESFFRALFLVVLNGTLEVNATGESFSNRGKTDIQIIVANRAVFIAECKEWSGPSGFKKALDQVLGYVIWSDPKVVLLFFSRSNEAPSAIVEKIDKEIPGIGGELVPSTREANGLRFRMKHPEDPLQPIEVLVRCYKVSKRS